jgi:protein SCO1/2
MHSSNRARRLWLALGMSLLIFSLAGFVWLYLKLKAVVSTSPNVSSLPVYTQLPDFSLTERSSRPLGLKNLLGKVWIADFIFTTCPGPCPRMSGRMAELQRSLSDQADVRLVSITVDPTTDTPQVLAEYANRFQASDRWFFLTGEKEAIHHLAKDGFLVGGVKDVMTHSTRFILVDRQGKIRGYYDSEGEESLKKLLKDVRWLLRPGAS